MITRNLSWLIAACCLVGGTVSLGPVARGDDGDWYAGIEVGSKGIKVIALPINSDGVPNLHLLVAKLPHRAVNNVSLKDLKNGLFRAEAIEEAQAAVKDFYEQLTAGGDAGRPKIKPANIWVVASSGLTMKKPANFDKLAEAISEATGGAKTLVEITPRREASLLLRGAIPRDQWDNAILVDIGSGNVRCGYIQPRRGPNVEQLAVPTLDLEGTTSYRQSIEKAMQANGGINDFRTFCLIASEKHQTYVDAVIGEVSRHPGLQNGERRRIYLSGGAPFAIASILHPLEMAKDTVTEVQVTKKEIQTFVKDLSDTEEVPPSPLADLSEADAQLARAKRAEAMDLFDVRNFMAGGEILIGFSEGLLWEEKQREVFFTKSGLVAWIVGFVVEERAKAARPTRP